MEHLCPLVHNTHSKLAFDGSAWWNTNQNWNSSLCIFVNMCFCVSMFVYLHFSKSPILCWHFTAALDGAHLCAPKGQHFRRLRITVQLTVYLRECQTRETFHHLWTMQRSVFTGNYHPLSKIWIISRIISRSRTIFPTTVAWDRRWPCQILIPRTSNDFRHP